MKKIDFTKYPKILPYISDRLQEISPSERNPLDEETFITIVSLWIDKFEKELLTLINNTDAIYSLTNEETGYSALSKDWEDIKRRFYPHGKERRFPKDLIRKWWVDKFSLCISQFYTFFYSTRTTEFKGGTTGCFITCDWYCRFADSEYKKVKYRVVSNITFSLSIQSGLHSTTDLYEFGE